MAGQASVAHLIEASEVKSRARGRWRDILSSVASINYASLDGAHHPCPRCAGRDRFRFTDMDGAGSAICNQCMPRDCGDGLAVVAWANGWGFSETVDQVAQHLGMIAARPASAADNTFDLGESSTPPKSSSHNGLTVTKPPKARPPTTPSVQNRLLSQIQLTGNNPDWLESFAAAKSPTIPSSISLAEGRCCTWDSIDCIAFPAFVDPSAPRTKDSLVGLILYRIDGGYFLARGKLDERKTHMIYGSKDGWVVTGTPADFAAATTVICTEGIPDAISVAHLLPPGYIAATNICGAGARRNLLTRPFAGKDVIVIGDADQPGQRGADLFARRLATSGIAKSVRFPQLPYDIVPTKGKDLRDFAGESGSWHPIANLIDRAAVLSPDPTPNEAPDDPHRLARAFIASEDHSSTPTGLPTYRFYREIWYRWDGVNFASVHNTELRGLVAAFIKREFDRLNIEDMRSSGASGGQPPVAMSVSGSIVSNVILAMSGECLVAGGALMPYWLDGRDESNQDGRHWICMANGLVDVRTLLTGDACDTPPSIIPHTPAFFTTVKIPYEFDYSAACPIWSKFMATNFQGDQERMEILQEWFGYNLVHDLTQQKFLMLEGESNNGKSVICAALTAMLGQDNVSSVPLENFEKDFHLTQTLGKLANIVSEAGEIEKVGEGYLKSFTSGDRMSFNRKNRDLIDTTPTARFTLSTNNRPRFSDKSGGIWRRMILMPLTHEVAKEDRVLGMDTVDWWNKTGELPGIFNWAMEGLRRLRQQGGFTESSINEAAKSDYRDDSNIVRQFLVENYHELPDDQIQIKSKSLDVYDKYRKWCAAHGNAPMADRMFGKEVKRVFKTVIKKQVGPRSDRYYIYLSLEVGPAPTAQDTEDGRERIKNEDYFA